MIKNFICDVDGCLTDGKIYWEAQGRKMFKAFGCHDADGLRLLRRLAPDLNILFISADSNGASISSSRIGHMGYKFSLVSEHDRFEFVQGFNFAETVFMGDGYWDAPVLRSAYLGIAPAQARPEARRAANYVTANCGGEGAVMDACMIILNEMGIIHDA